MISWQKLLVAVPLWTAHTAPAAQSRPSVTPDSRAETLLTDATIVDLRTERLLGKQAILIRDGHIVAIGPSATLRHSASARVVALGGKFVLPGLIDSHLHILGFRSNTGTFDMDAAWEYTTGMLLANGVTGARIPGGNLPELLARRHRVETGELVGPRIWVTGWKIDVSPTVTGAPFPMATPSDGVRSVQMLKAAGADFVKVLGDLPADQLWAILRESRRLGLPVESHTPRYVSLAEASDSGLTNVHHVFSIPIETSSDAARLRALKSPVSFWSRVEYAMTMLHLREESRSIERRAMDSYDVSVAQPLFARLRKNGTWATPTLALLAAMDGEPMATHDAQWVSVLKDFSQYDALRSGHRPRHTEAQAFEFATYLRLVKAMHDAGVGILAGSDSPTLNPPGYAIQDELDLLTRAGLTPAQALRTATVNVANMLCSDSTGTIRVGANADLIVLRENPLKSIRAVRKVETVVSGGRVYGRASLDSMLARSAVLIAQNRDRERKRESPLAK